MRPAAWMAAGWQGCRRHPRWACAGGALLLLAGLVVAFRAPLADLLWPEARAQALVEAGDRALAEGRLTATYGNGARELYEAALALDPDRDAARRGLQRVGRAAIAHARLAASRQQFPAARDALRLARALEVPRAEVDAVAEQMRLREARLAGVEALLAQAAQAHREERLDGGDAAALPLYARVLALQPTRKEALEGREDAISDLLQAAARDIDAGDFAAAAARVARARGFDPGHVGLPDAQARLARAADARRARAESLLRRGRLEEAAAAWNDVLALDPDDAAARAGLEAVARAHAARAQALAADFRFAQAERALAQARAIGASPRAVAQAQRHLQQSRERAAALQGAPGTTRRVAALLAAAAAAEARGDLLQPPGESAFDYVRRARALAPQDPRVRRAQARLLPAARRCFEEALPANRLVRAQACLDARVQLGEDAGDARRRLAQRWVGVGDERLGAGEIAAARRALDAATALDPETAGLDALAARVHAATREAR